ncbi:hypothetical protein EC991_006938, partial [Linnemannia zychae]
MLAKTSTLCHETQEILEHNGHSVRLHSESTTPNVLYGDVFSTVNQVCLTRESSGMTRVKCFAEVKFQKSILWSSRIEASAMEGCGLYYKELLRQLMESESTNSHQLDLMRYSAVPSNLSDSAQINQTLQNTSTLTNSASSYTTLALETAPAITSTLSQGYIGMSPAHSLLTQQHLRSLPAVAKVAQISTLSTDHVMDPINTNSTNNTIQTGSTKLSSMDRLTGMFWISLLRIPVDYLLGPTSIAAEITSERGATSRNQGGNTKVHSGTNSDKAPPQVDLSQTANTNDCTSLSTATAEISAQELVVASAASETLSRSY